MSDDQSGAITGSDDPVNDADGESGPDTNDESTVPDRSGGDRASTALAILATVLAVVSVLSVWVKTQALDTDEWVRLSTDLLDEQEVQEKLAAYLVDQLYERIEVSDDLGERLPDSLQDVASTLVAALRGPVTDGVERLIASDAFQSTWGDLNRTAHSTMVAILRDETRPGISTAEGEVALELRELLISVGSTIGFSGDRLEALPDDAGRIVIFESDELDTVQQAVRVLDFLSWFLFIAVIGLYAASVALARDRRVAALRRVGLSLAGGGVFVLLVRAIAVERLVDSLVADPANEPLADVVAANVTSLIRQMAWSAVIWGVLIALFAMLIGPGARARWIRRRITPVFELAPGAMLGAGVLLLLVLFWWDPGRALDGLLNATVTIALVIGAVLALRHRVLAERDGGPAGEVAERDDESRHADADEATRV